MSGELFSQSEWGTENVAGEAEARRDAGIERSAAAAGPEWADVAVEVLREYLRQHPTLHVDDVELPETDHPNAAGAVYRRAKTLGWMELQQIPDPHGPGMVTLCRPSDASNRQYKPVWRSLLWR